MRMVKTNCGFIQVCFPFNPLFSFFSSRYKQKSQKIQAICCDKVTQNSIDKMGVCHNSFLSQKKSKSHQKIKGSCICCGSKFFSPSRLSNVPRKVCQILFHHQTCSYIPKKKPDTLKPRLFVLHKVWHKSERNVQLLFQLTNRCAIIGTNPSALRFWNQKFIFFSKIFIIITMILKYSFAFKKNKQGVGKPPMEWTYSINFPQALQTNPLLAENNSNIMRGILFCDLFFNIPTHLSGISGLIMQILESTGHFGFLSFFFLFKQNFSYFFFECEKGMSKIGKFFAFIVNGGSKTVFKKWMAEIYEPGNILFIVPAHGDLILDHCSMRLRQV